MQRLVKGLRGCFSSYIEKINARQILDSRGLPTVEVDLSTNRGLFRAMVPSGASTGSFEALELRDGQKQFHGKSVMQAVANVKNIIAPALLKQNVLDQFLLDQKMVEELDGTKNEYGWVKKKLGANSILPVSMAICRAAAFEENLPLYKYIARLCGNNSQEKFFLPIPSFNVINGGKHAGNALAFQEFMIFPSGAKTFREAVQMGSEIYHTLKKIIKKEYGQNGTNVGDEGGFAPDLNTEHQACQLLVKAIEESGYTGKVKIAIDAAASEFWNEKENGYDLGFKSPSKKVMSNEAFINYYGELIEKYPIVSIEDPLYENDFESWSVFTEKFGKKVQVVGDDLVVTNPTRIQTALNKKSCNALLLKINQIGSILESITACKLA